MLIKRNIGLFAAFILLIMVACNPVSNNTSPPDFESISESADIIYYNGVLITMEPGQPLAQAIAIKGETILAVGTNDQVKAFADDKTVMIDLQGRTLMPGFIDSHSHWFGDRSMGQHTSLQEVVEILLARGWTSINELFVNQVRLDELRALDKAGELPIRVNAYLPVNYTDDKFGAWYLNYTPKSYITPHLRLAGIKIFIDHSWNTQIHWTQDELNGYVLEAHKNGWQIAAHTISQEALDMVLGALQQIYMLEPNADPRLRIEHAIQVNDQQIHQIAEFGAIASIQPMSLAEVTTEEGYLQFVGGHSEMIARWHDLAENSVITIASTDYPWMIQEDFHGDPPSPFTVIYQATNFGGNLGTAAGPNRISQTLTVEQILQMLTINSAFATFEEDRKGSLAPSKWADLVVLNANPYEVDITETKNIQVLMTMIGGQAEYCLEAEEDLCAAKVQETNFIEDYHLAQPPGVLLKLPLISRSNIYHARTIHYTA